MSSERQPRRIAQRQRLSARRNVLPDEGDKQRRKDAGMVGRMGGCRSWATWRHDNGTAASYRFTTQRRRRRRRRRRRWSTTHRVDLTCHRASACFPLKLIASSLIARFGSESRWHSRTSSVLCPIRYFGCKNNLYPHNLSYHNPYTLVIKSNLNPFCRAWNALPKKIVTRFVLLLSGVNWRYSLPTWPLTVNCRDIYSKPSFYFILNFYI